MVARSYTQTLWSPITVKRTQTQTETETEIETERQRNRQRKRANVCVCMYACACVHKIQKSHTNLLNGGQVIHTDALVSHHREAHNIAVLALPLVEDLEKE